MYLYASDESIDSAHFDGEEVINGEGKRRLRVGVILYWSLFLIYGG